MLSLLAIASSSMETNPKPTGKTTGLSTHEEDNNTTTQNQTTVSSGSLQRQPNAPVMNPLHQSNTTNAMMGLNPEAAAQLVSSAALLELALAQDQQRKYQLLHSQLAVLSAALPRLPTSYPSTAGMSSTGTTPPHSSLLSSTGTTTSPPLAAAAPSPLAAPASNQLPLTSLLGAASLASKITPSTASQYLLQQQTAAHNLAMLSRASAPVPPQQHAEAMSPSVAAALGLGSSYFDASTIPDPQADALIAKKPRRGGGASEPFPQKLYRMLTELQQQQGGSDIATFLPHGRAFAIHNPKKFVAEIMPRYFRMSRFSSFQRQLNLYDYKRITEGRDKGAYYHELFLQGRPALCAQMKRTKIKGTTSWIGRGGFHEEVNFYSMPPIQINKSPSKEESEHKTMQNGAVKEESTGGKMS